MTLDELLKDLMKIKELYPDSGKWTLVADLENLDSDVEINRVRIIGTQIVFED